MAGSKSQLPAKDTKAVPGAPSAPGVKAAKGTKPPVRKAKKRKGK